MTCYIEREMTLSVLRTGPGRGRISVGSHKIGEVFRSGEGWMAIVYGLPDMWPLTPGRVVKRVSWKKLTEKLVERWETARLGLWAWEISEPDGFRLVFGRQPIGTVWRIPSEYHFTVSFDDHRHNPHEIFRYWTLYEAMEDLRQLLATGEIELEEECT